MRHIIFILILALLTGCKTRKDIVCNKSLDIDSVAHSERHLSVITLDSLIRHIDFSFDTLKINIERPADERISLMATRGRVTDTRRFSRNQVETSDLLDTLAYSRSAAESLTQHTSATGLYDPPSATTILVIALLIFVILSSRNKRRAP